MDPAVVNFIAIIDGLHDILQSYSYCVTQSISAGDFTTDVVDNHPNERTELAILVNLIELEKEGKVVTKARPTTERRSRRDALLTEIYNCNDLNADIITAAGGVTMENYRCDCDIEPRNFPSDSANAVYRVHDHCFLAAEVDDDAEQTGGGGGGGGGAGSPDGGGGGGLSGGAIAGIVVGGLAGVALILLGVQYARTGTLPRLWPPGTAGANPDTLPLLMEGPGGAKY